MKTLLPILAAASTVLLAGCYPFASPYDGLSEKPQLQKSFAYTAVRKQLDGVGVVQLLLSCDTKTKTVSGTFDFWALAGREPVTITGVTPCTKAGALFLWLEPEWVRARENYKVDLIEHEVQTLVARGSITPMTVNRDDEAAARGITQSFGSAVQVRKVQRVEFTCKKDGEPYRYVSWAAHNEVESGTLKSRCVKARQNFSVAWRDTFLMSPADRDSKPALRVWDFNGVAPDTIMTAFGEFIGDGLPQSKF